LPELATLLLVNLSAYISAMTDTFTGPVAREIAQRLTAALSPLSLNVLNDSEKHRGHGGYDRSGESHFTVEVVAEAFVGMSRLDRQRAVNAALGDLLHQRVHALAIRARAPGE
jgi:BolA protein